MANIPALVTRDQTDRGAEYRPLVRIPDIIQLDPGRKAFWCQLCCASRIVNGNLSDHYRKAHPGVDRDPISRKCTTYADSRHGRPDQQTVNQIPSTLGEAFAAVSQLVEGYYRPTAQLRPAKRPFYGGESETSSSTNSRKAKETAAGRLQILSSDILGYKEKKRPRRVVDVDRQKAPLMQSRPLSRKNTQDRGKIVNLKVRSPPTSPEMPQRKHRRTAEQLTQEVDYWGGVIDDSSNDDVGSIPHSPPPRGHWADTMENTSEAPCGMSFDLAAAVNAGGHFAGEAQRGSINDPISLSSDSLSPINALAPSEGSADGRGLSLLETKVGQLFQKHAESQELLVEVMEVVMTKSE
jgi:hypothetical protein